MALQASSASTRRLSARKLAPLTAAIALCCAASAHPATIVVNSASDTAVTGKCSLFDAVQALNQAVAVDACVRGDGSNDTIDLSFFSSPTSITFSLAFPSDSKSALALTKPVTIRGNLDANGTPLVTLARSTVTGTPKFRLIGTSANLTVRGVQLTGGIAPGRGGAIYASGAANLTLDHVVVSNNSTITTSTYSGGGVDAESGSITVLSSVITGNSARGSGGGIYTPNTGTISVSDTSLGYNTALASGGAIASFKGSVTANGSTLYGNSAYKGGGIYTHTSTTLTNSTVTGNSAHFGGGIYTFASGFFYFSTVAKNEVSAGGGGGGVFAPQYHESAPNYLKAQATIFARNSINDVNVGQYATCAGGNNIVMSSSGTCSPSGNSCDPNLGMLQFNGGPTQTMLPSGTCAIDHGPASAPASIPTDQRGAHFLRKFGTATDIGAVEVQTNERIFYDGFDRAT